MEIPKAQVLDMIKQKGSGDQADHGDKELPEHPKDLRGKVSGGKIPGP